MGSWFAAVRLKLFDVDRMSACFCKAEFRWVNRVMLIDKEYTRALVGSGSADYRWLLSRTSGLSETAKSELLAEAQRRGYDTGRLIWVRQEKDETTDISKRKEEEP